MNYNEALNFIAKKQSLGIKPGLIRIKNLLDLMGNPQNRLKIIHIAGTNGKGTVANSVANSLSNSGYKVGLFTSPWVIDYREQIQINGKFIGEQELAQYVSLYGDNDCTEFELLTAIMYKYFADNSVDYAVIECGMGGKGDATNVCDQSIVSVITSVALDHTDYLGDTIEKIATEKAGIIKPNSFCVLYPNADCQSVFEKVCDDVDAKLVKVSQQNDYLQNNIATVQAVLDVLGVNSIAKIPDLPARQQVVNGVLFDGAHNVDGANALKNNMPEGSVCAVIGMMRDKDVEGYLSIILPLCDRVITTTPDNTRAMPADDLKKIALRYCKNVVSVSSPQQALELAKENSDNVVVCGSFYLCRELL